MLRAATLIAAILLAWGMAPPSEPRPWPLDEPISYHTATSWDGSVEAAVDQWERVGLVDFVEVKDPAKADLLFETNDEELHDRCSTCSGYAIPIGRADEGPNRILIQEGPSPWNEKVNASKTMLVVHEIGHALGLTHSDSNGCRAVMNPSRICDYDVEYDVLSPRVAGAGIELSERIVWKSFACGPFSEDLDRLEALYQTELGRVESRCQGLEQGL